MSPLSTPGAGETPVCSVLDIPGPRWFGPKDPIWRVNGDAATPIGITTGLLMLAAAPSCAAIFQLSGAVEQPWSVDDFMHDLTEITTFGTVDDAMVTIERAFSQRGTFTGTTEYGDYFYGSDPALMDWAQAAATWARLAAYQRFAAEPLSPKDSDLYVEQSAHISRLLGARTPPTTVRQLEQLLRRTRDQARPTRAGRRLAAQLRATARPCRGPVDTSVKAHRSCVTVVDAASSVAPSDVRRALALPHRVMDRAAVFQRISAAHKGLGTPLVSTRAPIAAPSAMRVQPEEQRAEPA